MFNPRCAFLHFETVQQPYDNSLLIMESWRRGISDAAQYF